MNDPYSILGIPQTAHDDEVKKAYRDLARKYHPDNYQNNPLADLAEEKMKEVNEAYDIITKMRAGGGNSNYRPNNGYQQQQSSAGNPSFARVRNMINMGDLVSAERAMMEIQTKNGEWYFLTGSIAYRKGWLDEAMQNYNIACQMEPSNMEYRQAMAMMQRGGGAYRPRGQQQGAMDSMDCCTTLMCLNCLCGGNGC